MAVVTITLTDMPDGECNIEVKNQPPAAEDELTKAQSFGVAVLQGIAMQQTCKSLNDGYRAAEKGGG